TYTVGGLAAGTVDLWASADRTCPSDPGWVTIHHPDQPNAVFSAPIRLAVGERVQWDVILPHDDDHDAMDDDWEGAMGLDPAVDDGGDDPDRDGFTNLEEYLLGTDPHDRDPGCGCAGTAPVGGLWLAGGVAALTRSGRSRCSSRARPARSR
ncbi:MAG: hypothetical protein ABMB14_37930, partial [Myxococcota bacterium]